jgi:hypothetical protein
MININYNLKRHIELLKQEKKILNEKKSFLKENPKEALELIKYGAKVSQHIVWEDRFEIASVMEDFLSKKINAHKLKGRNKRFYRPCILNASILKRISMKPNYYILLLKMDFLNFK